jgi:hypothetical protein
MVVEEEEVLVVLLRDLVVHLQEMVLVVEVVDIIQRVQIQEVLVVHMVVLVVMVQDLLTLLAAAADLVLLVQMPLHLDPEDMDLKLLQLLETQYRHQLQQEVVWVMTELMDLEQDQHQEDFGLLVVEVEVEETLELQALEVLVEVEVIDLLVLQKDW